MGPSPFSANRKEGAGDCNNRHMSTSDEVAAAYAAWTAAHKQLVEAEQELALLGPNVNVALRTAAQARIATLRAESDRLLTEANFVMKRFDASKPG